MAEYLVEEDGGGAAAEDGRPVKGLGDGGLAEGFEALAKLAEFGFDFGLRGKAVRGLRFECAGADQVHAVFGAGGGDDDDARELVWGDELGALGGDVVVGLVLDAEDDEVLVDVRVVAKEFGEGAEAVLPGGAVKFDWRGGLSDGELGLFLAEVGGVVFLLGANFGLGLDAEEVVEGGAVAGGGGQPEGACEGVAVVGEGQGRGVDGGTAVVAVGVVELGRAEADLDIGGARVVGGAGEQGAVLRLDGGRLGISDGIAEEVGRNLVLIALAAELGEGAVQLGVHDVEKDGGGRLLGGERCGGEEDQAASEGANQAPRCGRASFCFHGARSLG